MTTEADGQAVQRALAAFQQWQDEPARAETEGPPRLLALVEAVRRHCVHGDGIDAEAVRALREATGLAFRVEGDAVLFELADDHNPGKTQTVSVRAASADLAA